MSTAVSVSLLFAITPACLIGGVKGSQSVLWALHAVWLMKSGGREGSQSVHVSMCVRSLAWKGRHGSSPELNIPAITPPHSPDNLVSVIAHFFPAFFYPSSAIRCLSLGILFFQPLDSSLSMLTSLQIPVCLSLRPYERASSECVSFWRN